MVNRELIWNTFLTQLGTIAQFKVISRVIEDIDDLERSDLPCLFIYEGNESIFTDRGMPPKLILNCDIYIYTPRDDRRNANQLTEVNGYLDKICQFFRTDNFVSGVNTINELVYSCKLNGEIRKNPLEHTKVGSVVVIPIQIITTI